MATRLARAAVAQAALVGVLVLASFAMAAPAPGGPPAGSAARLDSAVRHWRESGSPERLRVIVRVTPGRRGAVSRALRASGLDVKVEHPLIDAITVAVPRAALEGLARNPHVETISLDAPVAPHATVGPDGMTLRTALGLPATRASRGAGVGIGIVDSGLTASNVFGSRITAFYDFTSGSARAAAAIDPYGHGTHVAGVAAGSGAASNWLYQGVAPAASLVGLRVLDAFGRGSTSTVISAIEFAIANRAALGIDVLNLSLGHPIFESAATDPLVQAVEAAARSGIVVVVSAGNYGRNLSTGEAGYGGITSPGNAASAITVGAVDINATQARGDDAVAPYSSRGPTWYDGEAKPDIVAPGHLLTAVASASSTLYQTYPAARVTVPGDANHYLRLSGTSMAAAVVSGLVAAMIEVHRNAFWSAAKLSPNTIKAILQFTAGPMTDPASGLRYDELTQGAGEANADGALELAKIIDPSAPLGAAWVSNPPAPASTIAGEPIAWSQHIVWGSHIVWGNTVCFHEAAWDVGTPWDAQDAHIVWGNVDPAHIVWGNTLTWSSHIVWGDAFVGTVDGEHIVWGNVSGAATTVWRDLDAQHIVWGDSVAGDGLAW